MAQIRIIAMVFIGLTVILFGAILRLPNAPPPAQIQLTTFANTEIYSDDKVHPGTFRIELSKEEILRRASSSQERLMIVYPHTPHSSVVEKDYVEYWLPATGSAFYHTVEILPNPTLAGIRKIDLVDNSLLVHYSYSTIRFLGFVLSAIFAVIGILLFRKFD